MARVTIEDCISVVQNRFELVLLAAQRARDISAGQDPMVSRDNDKNAVIALREIAEEHLELEDLKSNIIRGVNRHDIDVSEDEKLASLQQEHQDSDKNINLNDSELSFTELEHEAPEISITEGDVLAAAEDLFATEDDSEDEDFEVMLEDGSDEVAEEAAEEK